MAEKEDVDESVDMFKEIVIPQESTLEITYNEVYNIAYTEYFHHISEEDLEKSKEMLKNIFDGMKQGEDKVIITNKYIRDMQTIRLYIITKNPALYIFAISGEYFIQSLFHFRDEDTDKDNFDMEGRSSVLLNLLHELVTAILDKNVSFENDIDD